MRFHVEAGLETPLVLFGFNPQPEPPPHLVAMQSLDPNTAVQELSGIEPTPFQIFLGGEGGSFSVPSEPVVDFDQLVIGYTTAGGQDLSFVLRLTPDGDGDLSTGISDPLFFNPQPEPPPGFVSTGFEFAFDSVSSGGTAVVSVQVLDEGGEPLLLIAESALLPALHPALGRAVLPALLLALGAGALALRARRRGATAS